MALECPHPTDLLQRGRTVADAEISIGRLGDALIVCGLEKQAIVDAYVKAQTILAE